LSVIQVVHRGVLARDKYAAGSPGTATSSSIRKSAGEAAGRQSRRIGDNQREHPGFWGAAGTPRAHPSSTSSHPRGPGPPPRPLVVAGLRGLNESGRAVPLPIEDPPLARHHLLQIAFTTKTRGCQLGSPFVLRDLSADAVTDPPSLHLADRCEMPLRVPASRCFSARRRFPERATPSRRASALRALPAPSRRSPPVPPPGVAGGSARSLRPSG